jgi:ribosomal protein S18 acetylase RimI-like enzyme
MAVAEILPLDEEYRSWANNLIADRWGAVEIVTRGRVHDTYLLPGFVAIHLGKPAGVATYRIDGGQCEMVSLDSLVEGMGIGSALVEAVEETAIAHDCKRLWLITTNDNSAAIRFYQRRGFCLVAVHRNALDDSRRLKPGIPLVGKDGIPLRDEIELEKMLQETRKG